MSQQQSIFPTGGAVFSDDRKYRYSLWRDLGGDSAQRRPWTESLKQVCFVMLNPSVADADVNDRTVTRCIGYAKSWGYGRLVVVNLFAFVSTDPDPITKYGDAITGDPQNIDTIVGAATSSQLVVAAWGATPIPNKQRPRQVAMRMLEAGAPPLTCLRITAKGHPNHPLYLPANLKPVPYFPSAHA